VKNFKSILFDDKEEGLLTYTKDKDFIKDLNLSQIIDKIVSSKKSYDLEGFFYTPLQDEELVIFRQDIFKDLQNRNVFELFKNFEKFFNRIKNYLQNSKKLTNRYQKMSWLHTGALEYVCGLEKFYHDFMILDIHSKGLKDFREFLKNYLSSKKFSLLSKKAKEVESKLADINYVIKIKGGCIELIDRDETFDLEKDIESFFYRFTKDEKTGELHDFEEFLDLDHVRECILGMVAKKYPVEFTLFETFYDDIQDFMDKKIERFDREIQFFIGYLEFIKTIGSKYFSYPSFTDSGDIRISSFFDILLFLNLKQSGRTPVFNDLDIKNKQRGVVITGPNQGGKTTFARSVGELFYLSSLGCLVPAKRASIFLQDSIYTHFEKEERVASLKSKLEDDLIRIKEILDLSTSQSIVIINEIFSSTTLEDATEISKKIIGKLLDKGSLFLLVTFIDELSRYDERILSLVAKIKEGERAYKIVPRQADGKVYAKTIAQKYSLSYEEILDRIK